MSEQNTPYRVLARKYRPQNFDELIGQDALVRTLKNAIESGRVAHAFMLTGVRGVGKTTTARIIAKALNYTGPDGKSEATTGDTSNCALCQAITEDRHPDIMEMDAASRTGVDDIREILDGVRYAPTEARYKIYVIDEVHMLSKNAFNALLKTLEEPPEHVKFIFATTEIRKVPITVLSRCQRFDLRRVGIQELIPHFQSICEQESIKAEEDALSMIARAADGSVRDGLSILDQAIALSDDTITAENVKNMLGLSDRAQSLDLLEHALGGNIKDALGVMESMYENGANPNQLIEDLLNLTHELTKARAVPENEQASEKIKELASKLSMPSLNKSWQILLKGLNEVLTAPNAQTAAEMVIIRLTYAANLPDPGDLVKKLQENPEIQNTPAATSTAPQNNTSPPVHAQTSSQTAQAQAIAAEPVQQNQILASLEDIITLLRDNQELLLAEQLYHFAHLIRIEQGRLELRLETEAPSELSRNLPKALKTLTGQHWMVALSQERGAETLAQRDETKRLQKLQDMAQEPIVKNILEIFPDANLVKVLDKKTLKNKDH